MNDPAGQDATTPVVRAALDTWKRELLDLTRRNRALNFRPLTVSTVALVDEQPAEVFRHLWTDAGSMRFAPAPESDHQPPAVAADDDAEVGESAVPFETDEHITSETTFVPYDRVALPDHHTDDVLQTSLDADHLDRSLRRIDEQARLSIEEQGVNTLFLALGLLHYTESDDSVVVFKAPLVLVPATLSRTSARSPFKVAAADDDPMVNPALAEMLVRQYGIALPPLPGGDNDENEDLVPFFADVQRAVERHPRWKVTNDIVLGLFSFQKFVMYKDLEAHGSAAVAHRLVTQLVTRRGSVGAGGLSLPEDVRQVRLDDAFPPESGAHVVDADGSQHRALVAVAKGYDLVIEGPPGTGKSQTITNLVAQALQADKTVLFVAEKMAALDVVHSRLQAAGLGEFCLELHSTKASRREVIGSIARALDASLEPPPGTRDAGGKLPGVRQTLTDYAEALHQPHDPLGVSPYRAYGELARVLDAPRIDLTFALDTLTRPDLDLAVSRLTSLAAAAAAAGDVTSHPWRDSRRTFYPLDQLDGIVDRARDAVRQVTTVQEAAATASATLGLPSLERLIDLDTHRTLAALLRQSPGAPTAVLQSDAWHDVPSDAANLIARVRERQRLHAAATACVTDAALADDHTSDIAHVERTTVGLWSLFWWLDSRHRAIRTRWHAYRRPGYSPSMAQQAHDMKTVVALRNTMADLESRTEAGRALFGGLWRGVASDPDELERYAAWVVAFRRACVEASLEAAAVERAAAGHVDMTTFDRLDAEGTSLRAAFDAIERHVQWPEAYLSTLPLTEAAARLDAIATQAGLAARWGAYVVARDEALATCGADAVHQGVLGRVPFDDLPRALLRAFWFAWLADVVARRPSLERFQALTHEQRVREFCALDRQVLDDNRARLIGDLRERVQARLRTDEVDAAMPGLRREMVKQRRHRPLRQTLRDADAAVRAIKRVWLMSPLSVAQFTRGDAPTFDLVVFDEASQLPPEDAVGAIIRGHQLVVVGDPKQLPPTDFFSTRDDPATGDDADVPDAESILEAFMGSGVPMSRLKWHYRSAHESLIAFSNVSFYDGDLYTFPSVEQKHASLGLHFVHVPDGVYEGKGLNLEEARRVARDVVAFAREQLAVERNGGRPLSLGVGTFNLRQQLAVQDLLEVHRRDDPSIEPFFDRSRSDPFFVKNLENIQGDERDVIFLSVTYAKARDGRLRQHFGPLNGENGWRRLNVIATRSRRCMRLYASMRASDIREGTSRGGPLLKAFLEYADTGRLDHPAVTATASAESPFEREVAADLARRGYIVESQVGVAGYRIDIGIVDPEAPGRYLLGIECDGVAYHSSDTARDRDRLRQQVLEARGWRIVRLWSTDWFKDRQGQLERLMRTIDEARVSDRHTEEPAPAPLEDAPSPEPDVRPAMDHAATDTQAGTTTAYVVATAPERLPSSDLLSTQESALADVVIGVVAVEFPIHEDELVSRVASFWRQRSGARIRARVLAACAAAVRRGAVERRDAFLWVPGGTCVVRNRAGIRQAAERIAPEEYAAALQLALSDGRVLPRAALFADARSRLGFERTGALIERSMNMALDQLLEMRRVGEASQGLRAL